MREVSPELQETNIVIIQIEAAGSRQQALALTPKTAFAFQPAAPAIRSCQEISDGN